MTLSRKAVLAVLIIGSCGEQGLFIMPFIFGNIIDRFELAEWVVTIIVSAQFSFVAIGSLGIGSFLPRVNFRIISFVAILSMAVGNLISMLSPNPIWLVIGRCFTGLGEGMCLGIAHGLACYTKNPDRTFSVMMFIEVIFAALIILLVPTAIKQLGIEGIFLVMTAISVIIAPFILFLPDSIMAVSESKIDYQSVWSNRLGCVLLFCMGLTIMGTETLWLFMERIGLEVGLSYEAIANVAAASITFALLGPALVFIIGNRYGRLKPISIALVLLILGGLLQTQFQVATLYIISIFLLNLVLMFILPFLRSTMAEVDPTGRIVAMSAAAYYLGNAIGPITTGILMKPLGHYAVIGWIAGFYFTVVLITVFLQRKHIN